MVTASNPNWHRGAPTPISPLPGPVWTAADLPVPPTPFVGREREVETVRALLDRQDVRLVTVMGSGGAGKSRLALQVAATVRERFAGGVVFVPLVTVSDPGDVERALALAIGLHGGTESRSGERLIAALRDAECLLLLDNFEHVAAAAPGLAPILASCPGLNMLVTSRTALRLAGEHTYLMPPLSLPESHTHLASEEIAAIDAVRLFALRATAVAPDFTLTPMNVPLVVDICRHLDGLPLAIELAAARVSHLALPTLLDRLEHRLPLLTGGGRDQPPRHQTMRNAIAWSHDLLTDDDRILFRRLAVFAGGFTLEAAEAVYGRAEGGRRKAGETPSSAFRLPPSALPSSAALRPPPSALVLDGLATLIDGSLLRYETATGRYGWLETIREYAAGQLAESGEEACVRDAHAAYFLELAEQYHLAGLAPPESRAVVRLQADLPNLRSALAWFDERGDPSGLLRLATALGRFWSAQALYREGTGWLQRALALGTEAPVDLQARAMVLLGMVSMFQGDVPGATARLSEGLSLCRHVGDTLNTAQALIGLGSLALQRGEVDEAETSLREVVTAAETLDNRRLATIMRGTGYANLGLAARCRGEFETAQELHEEALRSYRETGYHQGIVLALGDLGEVARERGEYSRALSRYRELLELNREGGESGSPRVVHDALNASGVVTMALGRAEQAARWFGAAEVVRERTGLGYLVPVDRSFYERSVAAARTALGDAAFALAWAAGRELTADRAVAEVLDVADDAPTPKTSLPLTPRELDVLRLVVAGCTDREIAEQLFISVRTVETHIVHSYTKLGTRSRAAAAAAVIAAGLVPNSQPAGNSD